MSARRGRVRVAHRPVEGRARLREQPARAPPLEVDHVLLDRGLPAVAEPMDHGRGSPRPASLDRDGVDLDDPGAPPRRAAAGWPGSDRGPEQTATHPPRRTGSSESRSAPGANRRHVPPGRARSGQRRRSRRRPRPVPLRDPRARRSRVPSPAPRDWPGPQHRPDRCRRPLGLPQRGDRRVRDRSWGASRRFRIPSPPRLLRIPRRPARSGARPRRSTFPPSRHERSTAGSVGCDSYAASKCPSLLPSPPGLESIPTRGRS